MLRFFFFQANPSLNTELLSSGIVSLLVNIACRGTTFSGQWILRDLEVRTISPQFSVDKFVFVFIYLPHDYNNYKEMPKKNVGRNGEEA